MQAIRIVVKGKVQGIFYRASAKEQADAIGLSGWVRNCRDGSVELHAQGTDEQVNHIVGWCRQGPAGATVEDVLVEQKEQQPVSGFSIRRG